MVATDAIDVRQEYVHDDVQSRERINSEDAFDIVPTSSSAWRKGLKIINNAKELNPDPAAVQRIAHADAVNAIGNQIAFNGDGDDPYSATPRRSMMQPPQGSSSKPRQEPGKPYAQIAAAIRATNKVTRKLSKSMHLKRAKQSLAVPSVTKESARSIQKGNKLSQSRKPPLLQGPTT